MTRHSCLDLIGSRRPVVLAAHLPKALKAISLERGMNHSFSDTLEQFSKIPLVYNRNTDPMQAETSFNLYFKLYVINSFENDKEKCDWNFRIIRDFYVFQMLSLQSKHFQILRF